MSKFGQHSIFKHNLYLQKSTLSILLIVIASLLFGVFFSDFYTKGEPREAMVAQSMLRTGEYILPKVYGEEIAYKPPMMHWIIAQVSSLTGEVTEITSRIPSAVAMVVMSVVFFVFVANRSRYRQAYLATLMMITSFELHRSAITARVDMLLTMFIVLTLLALYRWEEAKQLKGFPWWIPLLISGGILTKGPVALILSLLIFGIYLLLLNKYPIKGIILSLIYISITSLLLPILWYIAAWRIGGTDFLYIAGAENIMRFFNITPSHLHYTLGHEAPIYVVPLYVLVGFLPWTLLLLFSVPYKKYLQSKGSTGVRRIKKALIERINGMSSLHLYSIVIVVVTILFYMIPSSKRSVYLLPIYPFVSLLMAYHVLNLIKNAKKSIRIFSIIISVITAILITASVTLMFGTSIIFETFPQISERTRMDIELISSSLNRYNVLTWGLIISMIAAIISLLYQNRRYNFTKLMYCNIIVVYLINLYIDGPVMINFKEHHCAKTFAIEVNKVIPPTTPLYIYNNLKDGFRNLYGPVFYLNRPVTDLHSATEPEGYILVWERDLEKLQEVWAKQYTFEVIFKDSRRIQEGGYALLVKFSKDQKK